MVTNNVVLQYETIINSCRESRHRNDQFCMKKGKLNHVLEMSAILEYMQEMSVILEYDFIAHNVWSEKNTGRMPLFWDVFKTFASA